MNNADLIIIYQVTISTLITIIGINYYQEVSAYPRPEGPRMSEANPRLSFCSAILMAHHQSTAKLK